MLFCHDNLIAVKTADTDSSAAGTDIECDNVCRLQSIPFAVNRANEGNRRAVSFERHRFTLSAPLLSQCLSTSERCYCPW